MKQLTQIRVFNIMLLPLLSRAIFYTENCAIEFLQDYLIKQHHNYVDFLLDNHNDLSSLEKRRLMAVLPKAVRFSLLENYASLTSKTDLLIYEWRNHENTYIRKIFEDSSAQNASWLIVINPSDISIENMPYLPIVNKIQFLRTSSDQDGVCAKYTILDIYQAASYTAKQVEIIGDWSSIRGFVHIAPPNRHNLTGYHFRCVTMEQTPFIYLSDNGPGDITELKEGFIKNIWSHFQNVFNFDYTCRRPSDNEWGTIRDGKWTGMLKEIEQGYANVIVTSLDFTPMRSKVLDFMQGAKITGSVLVVQRHLVEQNIWNRFIREFRIEAWLATVVLIFTAPLLLSYVSRNSPNEEKRVALQDAYVMTIGALSFQGSWLDVTSISSRFAFISILFGTLLIYSHYTSALVAQLTVHSDKTTRFETLQGMLDEGRYQFGFVKGHSFEDEFEHSKRSPFKEIWEQYFKNNLNSLPVSIQQGIDKVGLGNYVFMMERNEFLFNFADDCSVMILDKIYFRIASGIAFEKNSPFVKIFNRQLTKMRDSGMLDKYWQRWKPPTSLCEKTPLIALNLHQTFTAFLILFVGALVSICICFPLEKCGWFLKNTKRSAVKPYTMEYEKNKCNMSSSNTFKTNLFDSNYIF